MTTHLRRQSGLFPARCARCKTRSVPRILGTTPTGWFRVRDPRDGRFYYLCPEHRSEQR